MFTCPACTENTLMKDIRKGIGNGVEGQESAMQMVASGLSNVADEVTEGLSVISDKLSTGLSRISDELSTLAGIVQGGFDELKWELQQQTQALLSIDQTLKTPSQTQAREWREMAEQLRKRGCFDEATQWFLKSLEMSPLDFRTYVGLGMTYLRKNDFDKAEEVLTRSFPHAPTGCLNEEVLTRSFPHAPTGCLNKVALGKICTGKVVSIKNFGAFVELSPGQDGLCHISELADSYVESVGEVVKLGDIVRVKVTAIDDQGRVKLLSRKQAMAEEKKSGDLGKDGISQFDYKSLSHRLIGRICACKGDYGRAAAELRLAIELSPNYPEGNYDYALYCVQSGVRNVWEEPLHLAISARPGYLNVAWVERRFFPARQELKKLLSGLVNEAYRNAGQAIHDAETKFAEAKCAVANAPDAGGYKPRVNEITALLATTKSYLASKDYSKLLKACVNATRVATWSSSLAQQARDSSTAFLQEQKRQQQEKEQEKKRRQLEARKAIPGFIGQFLILGLYIGVAFGIVGGIAGVANHNGWRNTKAGFLLGIIFAVIWGIIEYMQQYR